MPKLNRVKDKRDFRDFLYHEHFRAKPHRLPKTVDLFTRVPEILDQGEWGSCTKHLCSLNMHLMQ